MTLEKNRFFTVEELARHIRVHPTTIRRWIKDGKVTAMKLGEGPTARYRISEMEATAFLNRLAASLAARDEAPASRKDSGHAPGK